MLTSLHLHMKSRRVSIKTRTPPASLPLKGQVTRHTTVKWSIGDKFGVGASIACEEVNTADTDENLFRLASARVQAPATGTKSERDLSYGCWESCPLRFPNFWRFFCWLLFLFLFLSLLFLSLLLSLVLLPSFQYFSTELQKLNLFDYSQTKSALRASLVTISGTLRNLDVNGNENGIKFK